AGKFSAQWRGQRMTQIMRPFDIEIPERRHPVARQTIAGRKLAVAGCLEVAVAHRISEHESLQRRTGLIAKQKSDSEREIAAGRISAEQNLRCVEPPVAAMVRDMSDNLGALVQRAGKLRFGRQRVVHADDGYLSGRREFTRDAVMRID